MSINRIGIISLGCPRNLVDSEVILSRLKEKGFIVGDLEGSDIAIVNTCAFIKEAKEESIEVILDLIDLKKKGKIKKIIVYGCLAQRYREELLKNFKEVDAFIGKLDLEEENKGTYSLTPVHYKYVKISEGCANLCSYCVIPKIKGRLKSRSIESIVREVQFLDSQGVKEINLVGQDITLYGLDLYGESRLLRLLKLILKNTKGISWIRLLYLHPAHLNDELIEFVAGQDRICKYMDIPIQHINDRILRLMGRKASRLYIDSLIDKARKKIKGVYLRTSVIVGFPTETDKEFDELVCFIKEKKFERLGAFVYSREEGTRAYDLDKQVHYKIKKKRFDIIMSAQKEIADKLNQFLIGKEKEVIIDVKSLEKEGLYEGRLEQDAPEVDGMVYVQAKKELYPGQIVKVKVVDTLEYDLVGEVI